MPRCSGAWVRPTPIRPPYKHPAENLDDADVDTFLSMLEGKEHPSSIFPPSPSRLTRQTYVSALSYVARHTFTPKRIAVLATAAAVLLGVALVIAIMTGPGTQLEIAEGPGATDNNPVALSVVATLTAEHDARWAEGALAPGAPLRAGQRLTLTEGFAEITTGRGAVAMLEAPCTFELHRDNRVGLDHGRLVATCRTPDSKGFTVETPKGRVIDLSTKFGVEVSYAGGMAAEVFEGSVAVESGDAGKPSERVLLTAGQGASTVTGRIVVTDALQEKTRFASLNSIARDRQWSTYRQKVVSDPSLLAFYTFEEGTGDVLSEARGDVRWNASISGARWGEGRLPGKHALVYTGQDENATFSAFASQQLPPDGSYTIAMWFNMHRIDETGWTSLMARGNDSWRFLARVINGQTDLGYYANRGTQNSEQGFADVHANAVQTNRWHQVVVTGSLRGDTVTTRLYLDGALQGENSFSRMPASQWPITIGSNAHPSQHYVFDGRIDEVVFFNRDLTEDEVRALHQAGAPPPA